MGVITAMTMRKTRADTQAQQRRDKWAKRLLAAYARDGGVTDREHLEASIELGDSAMFEPTLFWEFVEFVAASSVASDKLSGLGADGLYWLLRRHPDDYDKRLAGLVRQDARFRDLIREIDPDRIAPDVWRQMEAALAAD